MKYLCYTTFFPMILLPLFITWQAGAKMEDDFDLVYIAVQAQAPVVIDGELQEEVWQAAKSLHLKENMTGSTVVDSSRLTTVKICYDNENLYIGFTCYDTDIWGSLTERDQHLWKEEAVEVFLDVDDEVNTYIEIEVSPNNVLFDSYIVDPFHIDVEATSRFDFLNITTAVWVKGTINKRDDTDELWMVEIAVAFKEMIQDFDSDILKEAEWKANFYRIDRDKLGVYNYAWSPTGGRFHQPSVFGTLLFK